MMDALLLVIVLGALMLALGVDLAVLAAWVRGRWR
jgi:hypothetical protein